LLKKNKDRQIEAKELIKGKMIICHYKIKQISSPFLLYAADWAEAEWEKKEKKKSE